MNYSKCLMCSIDYKLTKYYNVKDICEECYIEYSDTTLEIEIE